MGYMTGCMQFNLHPIKKISSGSAFLRSLLFICIFAISSPSFAQTPKIDSLLNILKTQKEDTSKVNTLSELARAYLFDLDDLQKVGEYGSQQLALSLKLNFRKGIAYGYLNRAIFYRSSGELDSALVYDKKSLPVMIETGNKKGEGSCYSNIGMTLMYQGNLKEALTYMFKGVAMKAEIGDKKGMAIGYNNIGIIYLTQANYPEALTYQLKSLKIREALKDKIGISASYINIGNIMLAQRKADEALLYYRKSLKICEELNNLMGIGTANANMGNIYLERKNYRQARICFYKSLKAREQIDDKRGLAEVYNNIGSAYLQDNKIEEALIYHLKALKLQEKTGDKKGIAEACAGIAECYTKKKDFENAFRYCDRMLNIARELNYKEVIRDAYHNFSNLYTAQKQFEKALRYSNLYNDIKDSLLNKENFKQVSELNTKYETEKKAKDILLLTKETQLNQQQIKQQTFVRWVLTIGLVLLVFTIIGVYKRYLFKQRANLELMKTQNELYKVIEQKEKLTSILAHDLRTPLRFMMSISAYLDKSIQALNLKALEKLSGELSTSARHTYAFADELLTWLSIQRQSFTVQYSEVDLHALLNELSEFFKDIAKTQQTELKMDLPVFVSVETDKRLLKIILRNILDNAIKNTNPGEVMISISKQQEEIIEICIRDTGNGMTKEQLDQLDINNSYGFAFEIKSKLGFQIIKDLSALLHIKLAIESEMGKGTMITLQVPLGKNYKILTTEKN
jgi:two-component system sensor histidine kinase/response regulator